MSLRGSSKSRTICEVLREINDALQNNKELLSVISPKLCEAEAMGKKMSRKLKEYNKLVFADFWEQNKDYETDLDRRLSKEYTVIESTKK